MNGAKLLLYAGLVLVSTCVAAHVEQSLYAEAEGFFGFMQSIRRTLHAQPELMWKEEFTSRFIREKLTELNIKFQHPVAQTGIVATIGTGKAPKFALRSDIDALPILEETDASFKSKTDGKMHACGHDSHMAMLLGAAKLLKAREAQLTGTVLLVFQPAEEGGAGAKFMLEEGVLKGVQGIHGLHVMPTIPSGIITSKKVLLKPSAVSHGPKVLLLQPVAGVIMAGANEFHIAVEGRGGHAAMPHLSLDPVVAGAAIVNSLQHLISRVTNPVQGAVISVTRFNTGEGATNVIPDAVHLGGTLRALDIAQFKALEKRVTEVVESVAKAHGCKASIKWLKIPYIPVINDARMVDVVERVAQRFEGTQGKWERLPQPNMAGEDFAFFAEALPGAFTYLGIYNETAGSVHGLHTSKFTLDESVLPRGAALHAAVALELLKQHGAGSREEL